MGRSGGQLLTTDKVHAMKFSTRVAMLALVLSALPLAAETPKPLGQQLRVRWHGLTVEVIKDGASHPFGLDKEMMAVDLRSVKLLSAKASGEYRYLLFDIRGASRAAQYADTYCGRGEERSLVWLKVDGDWKRAASQSFVIESCFDTAHLEDEGAELSFQGLELDARGTTNRDPNKEDTSENRRLLDYEIRYSLQHPEDGLKLTLEPAKPE
jgi:hypothetical protein